mmetsp:Transcript_43915/g.86134  ORF Transcript_43915/g.86134 Transcript_43915/m.86134 type:complete len:225 (+) Transcript_43915:345-1019(+)
MVMSLLKRKFCAKFQNVRNILHAPINSSNLVHSPCLVHQAPRVLAQPAQFLSMSFQPFLVQSKHSPFLASTAFPVGIESVCIRVLEKPSGMHEHLVRFPDKITVSCRTNAGPELRKLRASICDGRNLPFRIDLPLFVRFVSGAIVLEPVHSIFCLEDCRDRFVGQLAPYLFEGFTDVVDIEWGHLLNSGFASLIDSGPAACYIDVLGRILTRIPSRILVHIPPG